jgi:DNA/RNA endonuclease G (NUC1)
VDNLYTQNSQKAAIASLVGQALADAYVNSTYFLARGHLAAKSDFVLAQPQRATFTFVNCAPQWQPFNGGNWNTLEQVRIHVH